MEMYSYRRELIADELLERHCNRLGRKGWCLIGMPREIRRPAPAGEPVESLWWDCLFQLVDRPSVAATVSGGINTLVATMAEAEEKAAS